MTSTLSKRHRSASPSSSASFASSSSSLPSSPTSKAFRPSSPSSLFTCTLPPSCSTTPSTFPTSALHEAHWRTYHAFVCRAAPSYLDEEEGRKGKERECGRVFPDERVLGMHFVECHDPLAGVRRERGEKIFACLHPSCGSHFLDPKKRRLHLIDKHGFPKEYFFAVTRWGIGDVLRKGGGMVRREWKDRGSGSGSGASAKSASPEVEGLGRGVGREEARGLVRAVKEEKEGGMVEEDPMEELVRNMGEAKIAMVPRAVRRKAKEKEKRFAMVMESGEGS